MVVGVLGFSRSGLRDWVIQRISAVILALYTFFILGFLLTHAEVDFISWQVLFSHPWVRIFSVLALLSLIMHAWIGIWIVTTDYIKPFSIRLLCQIAVIIALMGYLVWGIAIVWNVA
jgi:succinate dehydrogenase / fumarate reductase membrane anchor subunit